MEQKRQFNLNLTGLLKVLAEHLYSSRKVAIRELVQNAHDSIVRRGIDGVDYRPVITIQTNPREKTMIIEDNGTGMTDSDILTYLTTIGNSYTREFGERMSFLQPDRASQLIGQFGLGFLSAFLVASEVTLYTRSMNSEQGWRWFCDGSEYFDLSPVDYDVVGTRVELKVKPEAEYLLEDNTLTEAIRLYADFLGVPIYVNGDPTPVNLMMPPWDAPNREQAMADYIERVFRHRSPIHIIELHDQEVDLGHDTVVTPLRGFVFIPSMSVVSVREYGDLIIYIRRMFITDRERDLLPSWARFFRGVIDCPALQPTASRESIHQEDNYLAVQQALESQLLEGLRRVATQQPEVWRQIVVNHTDLVLGWITINNEFFDQVADLLPLRTSRGSMSLPDYLQQTNNTLYYVSQQIGSLQEQLLGEGFEVPVIDASWFAVRPFLEKYASRFGGIQLVQMDGDARRLMRPVTDSKYDDLLAYFQKRGVRARVASYKPYHVPALMLYPRNADTLIEARRALDANELNNPLAALIQEYLDQQKDDTESDGMGTLYLNTSSALIQQLVGQKPELRDTVLTLIYQIARLFAARTMSPADASQAFTEVSNSIQGMINHDH